MKIIRRQRSLLLFFALTAISLSLLEFIPRQYVEAQTTPPRDYTMIVTTDEATGLPAEAKVAVKTALDNRWQGVPPKENKFYLSGIRLEQNWALVNLYFREDNIDYSSSLRSPIENTFSMVLVKNNGEWSAALADEPLAASLVRLIPDSELSFEAKSTLFKFFPGPYKTTVSNVNYKYPWAKDSVKFFFTGVRVKNTYPCPNNSGWHGSKPYLGGQACHSLDFAPRLSQTVKNADILSPVTGYISNICKNPDSQKQAALAIRATNSDQIIGLWHLDKSTIPSQIKQGVLVNQGDFLGQMVTGDVDESSANCPLISQGTHIHVVAPAKPFTIDEYSYTEDSKVVYKEQTYNMSSYSGTDLTTTNSKTSSNTGSSCVPPSSGDWTITQSCKLTQNAIVDKNLIITDGQELVIEGSITLDMNLRDQKILVKPNSRLLIRSGARII